MYFFHLFRTLLPLRNPIGFGASDFVELAVAVLLVLLVMARVPSERLLRRLVERERLCFYSLAAISIVLRLLLLRGSPVPFGSGSDDFSYLLLGDTLAHGRLANPAHALPQFFETIFVLQEPSYSSIYPLGQGVALATGQFLLGTPWTAVLLLAGLFSALCYWMLRAWTTPLWAFVGGLVAVMEFGPLSAWTNSYWGGALSGIAGCLVFGALPRMKSAGSRRDAVLLGCGLGLEILTRPFEAVLLMVCVLLFFVLFWRERKDVRQWGLVLLALTPALVLTLAQDKAVTGRWTMLPYMLSRYEYGVPTSFTFQPVPVPHHSLTPQQALDYRAQSAIHGDSPETLQTFIERWAYRLRYNRFFLLPPLYIALAMFAFRVREWRLVWVLISLGMFSLGTNLYPYFYPHYVAAVTCLFLLVAVKGLEWMASLRSRGFATGELASRFIVLACATQFLFWYGIHLLGTEEVWPVTKYETADYINSGDPEGRVAVNRSLAAAPGKQLVFVRYWPRHRFQEWIHNAADVDRSQVVWANDLGGVENEKLVRYFRDRRVWLLEPDATPPRLTAYFDSATTSHR